jgi:DNA polymerase V
MELRGISCHEERDYDADPDSISCSRSFGEPATTQEALAESLASFTAQAAAKLRRHGLLAAGCNIYAQIFADGGGGECIGRTIVFSTPTDATNVILRGISDEVKYLYLPGIRYRKTGIVFFGLERPGTAHQMDLFLPPLPSSSVPVPSSLYKAIDALNARYGKGKVFSAAEGIGKKSWHMKRQKLSPRPTTRWDELMVVK